MDTEEAVPTVKKSGKHDIDSYVIPTKSMSMEDNGDIERPTLNESSSPPKMIRSQEHLNMAQTTQVEGKQVHANITVQHIVKIFSGDGDDFIEVSPEQVERVKTSK